MMDMRTFIHLYVNIYTLICDVQKKTLHKKTKEIPSLTSQKEKLASLKLEETSNTHIKKEVEVTSKEEIVNDEFRKQQVMETILDQLIEELKVVEALEKLILNFPTESIIASDNKHEKSTEICFGH